MKISIVYFTSTGRTASMAEEIKKGIAAADASIEVGLFPISEVTSYHEENVNFVNDSAAVIVGTPDYYAAEANQLKTWLDNCPCKLADKLCGAYATANFLQGGGLVCQLQRTLHHCRIRNKFCHLKDHLNHHEQCTQEKDNCQRPHMEQQPNAFFS